ncbi:hypothetical protein D3C86_2021900 [compost metagenome]
MKYIDRIDADFIDHITAFHDEECRCADSGDDFTHAKEVLAFQKKVADRIVLERIDAQGNH